MENYQKKNSCDFSKIFILFAINFFLTVIPFSPTFDLSFFIAFSSVVMTSQLFQSEEGLSPKIHSSFWLFLLFFMATTVLGNYLQIDSHVDKPLLDFLIWEEAIHLFLSMVVFFLLFKTIYFDLGILISMMLIFNLFYSFILKNIIEIGFNLNFLKFIFYNQDIQSQINQFVDQVIVKEKNLEEILGKVIDMVLSMIGIISNFFNILYFLIFIKLFSSLLSKISVQLSKIYIPSLLIWFFLGGWIIELFFFQSKFIDHLMVDHLIINKTHEFIMSSLLTLSFLYFIQGSSICLHFIKFMINFIKRKNRNYLVYLAIGFLLLILIEINTGFILNSFIVLIFFIGLFDQWIDYRKKLI